MRLPRAEYARIDERKVRDYLLDLDHEVGWSKAEFLTRLGFTRDAFEVLREALRELARTGRASPGEWGPHGLTFEVRGILTSPTGRSAPFMTVWIVRHGEDFPRFVTAYPGGRR